MRRFLRNATLITAGGLALGPLALMCPAVAAEPVETQTYSTVGVFGFTVPAGVTCIHFQVDGGSGGDAPGGGQGGVGGRTSGWVPVAPDDALELFVGGRGQDGTDGGQPGSGINGGAGGRYSTDYVGEPQLELVGGGGGGGSYLVADGAFSPYTTAGGGGGGGAGSQADTGGDGGTPAGNGVAGGGPEGGLGGVTGGSGSALGQTPAQLPAPGNSPFIFVGGGGGGGGNNGGLGGQSVYALNLQAGSGGGGGGGGSNLIAPEVVGGTEASAPEGDGQVVLSWQVGDTGECGDGFDPVDDDEPGDGGDDTNAGSTFDTGVTPSDLSNVIPLIGLAEGALIATVGAIVLATTRRRVATSSEEEG